MPRTASVTRDGQLLSASAIAFSSPRPHLADAIIHPCRKAAHRSVRRGLITRVGLTTACALFTIGSPVADELLLKNGDRLTGEVIARSGDKLEFKTEFAGIIQINWGAIETVRTTEPMTLTLEDDRIIHSHLVSNRPNDKLLVTEQATDRELLFDPNQLTSINPEPWTLGNGYKFSGRINIAAKYESGNDDTDEIDADAEALYRRKQHRLRALITYEKDNKDGQSTKNKWRLRSNYDYFPSRPWEWGIRVHKWYYGATAVAEKDQFADLTLRAGVGPHIGYQFIEGHAMNLSADAAFMRIHETYQHDPDNDYWAPGWQLEFDSYLFNDILQFYHRQTGYVGIGQGSNKVVWNSWSGLRVPLLAGFITSAEVQWEYDGQPAADTEKLDTTYRLKLGYQW